MATTTTRPLKIVLLGATGQVGRELLGPLAACGELVACDRRQADLERPEGVVQLLRREQPQVIVNAAAYTAVDRAESEPDRTRLVNATAVGLIAAEARRLDATLVHYSTDYVFDGMKAGCYAETDEAHPLSVYGGTKLEGERLIRSSGCRHWIFRTTWVYAAHGHNFVRTMLRLAREREELRVVADQFGAPTPARLIADVTATFVSWLAEPAAAPAAGLYHLAPRGETTWCGFARFVLAAARDQGLILRCGPEQVQAIVTADYPLPARRPPNSRLCTAKLEAALGKTLPEWQDGVIPVVAALAAESVS
ncbi:MAG: dTDP-4-dehydrorhamnose reductase [Planctomycetia bacterium]|nr:dTDP-4-dehydrorhamnose reductase [Planctomycetia bacterium]